MKDMRAARAAITKAKALLEDHPCHGVTIAEDRVGGIVLVANLYGEPDAALPDSIDGIRLVRKVAAEPVEIHPTA